MLVTLRLAQLWGWILSALHDCKGNQAGREMVLLRAFSVPGTVCVHIS